MTDYTGCQQKNIVHHPAHFLPYLKAQAEKKLMPHCQISLKSSLYNADFELHIVFFKINVTAALKKQVFTFLTILFFRPS